MFLSEWGVDYRILVVDDGSTDRTAALTRDLGPRCSTLRLTPQGGKGRAVRTAMLRATGRVLAFTDADLPFKLTALRQGYQWIRRGACEVVFGARDIEGAENLARRRLLRTHGHLRLPRNRPPHGLPRSDRHAVRAEAVQPRAPHWKFSPAPRSMALPSTPKWSC